LGWTYENGHGVTRDYNNASYWYLKAAEQGYARGQNHLGKMYEKGLGVEKDYQQALIWYKKAAGHDFPTANRNLKRITEKIKQATMKTGIAEGEEGQTGKPLQRAQHEPELADKGPGQTPGADACDEAMEMYNEGLDLSDNSSREASYYQRAIELCPDFPEAHNRLGEVYKSRGEYESAIKEFNQARKWSLFDQQRTNQPADPSLLVDQIINQGEIYRMLGQYDMAAGKFKRALRINPDSRVALNQLQYVNKMSGMYDNILLAPQERIATAIFTGIPGMALPKREFAVGLQWRSWEQEAPVPQDLIAGEQAPSERKNEVNELILDLRYGLTNNITIGLVPRLSSIRADVQLVAVGVDAKPRVTGFGDTVFMTKYRFWGTRKTHISAYHLLSIPTGDEDAEDEDQGVRRKIPLGSGSFNFTPGIALTTKQAPLTIHSNISYRITNGEQVGDEFNCDLAFAYPFSSNFISTTELNYRWRDTARRQQQIIIFTPGGPESPGPGEPVIIDATIMEKGGHTLFLSPGLQFILTEGLKLEFGVQLPIIKPEEGWVEQYVFHIGLRTF
jgi:tetratricopeptide (TPR) repeat protein